MTFLWLLEKILNIVYYGIIESLFEIQDSKCEIKNNNIRDSKFKI